MKKILRFILSLLVAFLFCGAINTTGVVFAEEVQQETGEDSAATINKNELKMTLIDLNINGDSTLIQQNGINVLIDAGGVLGSSDYIYNKIKDLETQRKIESIDKTYFEILEKNNEDFMAEKIKKQKESYCQPGKACCRQRSQCKQQRRQQVSSKAKHADFLVQDQPLAKGSRMAAITF